MHTVNKLYLSILLLFSVFIVLSPDFVHDFFYLPQLEAKTVAYLDEVQKKAAVSFLIARGLNASISVLQSLTITPLIGELQIGQILDPLNDMIERFSWVMLLVSISIGVEKLLLEIGHNIPLLGYFILLIILWFIAFYRQRYPQLNRSFHLLWQAFIVLLLLRFAMPLMLVTAEQMTEHFISAKQNTAHQSLIASQTRIEQLNTFDSLSQPKQSLQKIQQQTEIIIQQSLQLMTLFLFETIIYPLLCLWLLLHMVKQAVRLSPLPR